MECETFLSDNCLQDFLRTVKINKAATREENNEMFLQYQNGDLSIKDMIVKKNLGLVSSIVFRIGKNLNQEEKLEYIQSGVIGLIEAIDTFDLSMGTAFSTHAEYRIQMRINKYRYNNQRLVRRPQYIEEILGQYKKLLNAYSKAGKPLPSRNEICSILGISDSTLKRIEEDYQLDAISLDAPMKNDEQDSDDFGELIGNNETGFIEVLDKIVFEEILKTIKMNTTKYEYFILYYRMINEKQKTMKELGDYFGVTQQEICRIEKKIKLRIKKMFNDDYTLKRIYLNEVKEQYPFESIKITPCPMENYTMYFFLRDTFNEKDQIILKEILLGDLLFDSERIAIELMESKEYVEKKGLEIEKLILKANNDIHYNLFHSHLVKKYKNKIYRFELDCDLSDFLDIRSIINDYWRDKSVEEVFDLASLYNLSCKEEVVKKIKRFYGFAPKKEVSFNKEHIERHVNYSLYGFVTQEIPHSKLYPVYLENQDKFTAKQRDYLDKFVFKKKKSTQQDMLDFLEYYYTSVTNNKLVLLFFKIEDYKKDNFSYEKYMDIRQQCRKNMDERGLKLLDFYYGVSGTRMTIREISEYLKEEEKETEKDFRRAKNNAMALYLGTSQTSFDRNIYRSVLEDENFTLGSPHLEVANMFFLEGKSYEEIASNLEISQRKVSELVKYACNAMDYYRFGITSTQKNYSKEFLLSVLDKANYDQEIKDIMHTFIETKSTIRTAYVHQKDLEEVRNIVRRLNTLANKTSIEQVEVTKEDVEAAVMEHESINVLTERERTILSLVYGLKNKYNPSGKRMYPIDIGELLEIKNNIGTAIRKAKEHVAAHKIGLLKTTLDFINREELESVLRNQRLPLKEEDRKIIINAYGLYDSEYLTIHEIAKKYCLKEPIARKRIYKGVITIKKYLNKEIAGDVLFEVDIEPYLKYFILEDREILTLLYRDKVSQIEIEEKYGFSTHQFFILLQKMRMHLKDLHSGLVTGIDFDYFWSNALEDDIPFYGNQQLAAELCFLYYEKRITQSDIVQYYHPELNDTTVSELIRGFTVAVIKHQNGIRKAKKFSYEEVEEYYHLHKDSFYPSRTKIYERYFAKVKKCGPLTKTHPDKCITYDLIKEKYPDYFRLENTNAFQVKEILGNYGHLMSKDTVHILESLFGVTHANMLSDEDWEEIINFLGPLQLRKEKNTKININMGIENGENSKKKGKCKILS